MPSDTNDYKIIQTIVVQNPQQLFNIRTDCGEPQTVGVEGLILAVGEDAENISIGDYVLTDGNCTPTSPDCTLEEQQAQADFVANLISNPKDENDFDYPLYLVRVKLCNGDEVHLSAEEVRNLPGNHVELQRIFVSDATQTFQLGSNLSSEDTKDLFYQSLHYDDEDSGIQNVTQKNGNISYQTWQVRGRAEQIYKYTYDDLDRILTATFMERNDGMLLENDLYNTTYENYDANGNIGLITRNGLDFNNAGCAVGIDDLVLNYDGNRISSVRDKVSNAANRARGLNASSTATNSYVGYYDDKGNLTIDPFKNLNITYNHLNLPNQFSFTGGNSIQITYDAEGKKLRKTVVGSEAITKDYCSGIEYEDDVLKAVYNDEGRAVFQNGNWEFQYVIRDHLGNTRIMFKENNNELAVIQEEHYYAFGGSMEGEWNSLPQLVVNQDYKYNNKELNSEYGLDWMNFGARWYMTWIPHFSGVDPISEKFPHVSSFNYAENSPISNIDLHGLQKFFTANGSFIKQSGNNESIRILPEQKSKLRVNYSQLSTSKLNSMSVPVQVSTKENKNAVLATWAKKYKELGDRYNSSYKGDREFAMTLYGATLKDKDGSKVDVFVEGGLAKGVKGADGISLTQSKSPIDGWDATEAIHTHRWGDDAGNFSDDEGIGNYFEGDIQTSIRLGIPIYLAVPYSKWVGVFDPAIYRKAKEELSHKLAKYQATDSKHIKIE